jgi:hydrogenase nickel incorporation protein HypA/HybF
LHELSIASAILDQLETELAKHPGARFKKVGLKIGDLSGVDSDSLSFGFGALVKDSHWEPLDLEIESIKRRQRCPACNQEFEAEHWSTECKVCGNPATVTIAGEELQIAYIEVDE